MTMQPETISILKDFWTDRNSFADAFNSAVFEGRRMVLPEDLYPADPVTHLGPDCIDPVLRGVLNDFLDAWAADSVTYRWEDCGHPLNLCLKNQFQPDACTQAQIELYNALQIVGKAGSGALQELLDSSENCEAPREFYYRLVNAGVLVPTMVLVVYYGREPVDEAQRTVSFRSLVS